jgi:hypothetical protein
MADRRIDGFFYGLFMDAGVTLVPTRGERSYGVVMALTHAELDRLYAAPGLEDYRPEAVVARCLDGGPVPALCYTLLRVPEPGESNRTYATRLREVLKALDFPPEYVASVS